MHTESSEEALHNAITLRALVEQEQDEAEADGVDLLLLRILHSDIVDLKYTLRQIHCPYVSNLHRRAVLRQIMQDTDTILDKLNEHADGRPLPPAAIGLCKFLFQASFRAFRLVQEIEAELPDLAASFASERAEYRRMLNEAREAERIE